MSNRIILDLPATKTDAAPRMAWTRHADAPAGITGTLAVVCGKAACVYRVEELATGKQGWANDW